MVFARFYYCYFSFVFLVVFWLRFNFFVVGFRSIVIFVYFVRVWFVVGSILWCIFFLFWFNYEFFLVMYFGFV